MTVNITDKLPHLTVVDKSTGEIHLIALSAIRDVRNGNMVNQELSKIIATALLQFLGE